MPARSFLIGSQFLTLDVPSAKVDNGQRQTSSSIADLPQGVAKGLEKPLDFPALRSALTPDDHVAILVQEDMNGLSAILQALLLHLFSAEVKPENITLLFPPRLHSQLSKPDSDHPMPPWLAQLPSEFQACRIEEHHHESSHMSYLASTPKGRRIYLNRTLVDADQVIILGPVRFDPFFGVACGLADLFPTFSDQATKQELFHLPLSREGGVYANSSKKPHAIWQEADAVGWLLGMPFVIAVLEGPGDAILSVWAGGAEAVRQKAEASLREERQFHVSSEVDLVIGTVSCVPEQQSFAQIAAAAALGSRITRTNGAVAILSEVRSELPRGAETMQRAPDPSSGLGRLRHDPKADLMCWWQLATAVEKNKIYLFSHLPAQAVEDLWMIPLEKAAQVQNLINQAGKVLVIEDLHRSLPLLASN
jgi:nickel-dependent lactate racemase